MDCTNAISVSKNTILLSLYVTPGARKNCFPTGYNTWKKTLDISVKGVAQKNKANKDVIVLVATFFKLPLRNVTIVSGAASREKTIALKGITKDSVVNLLKEHFHGLSTSS